MYIGRTNQRRAARIHLAGLMEKERCAFLSGKRSGSDDQAAIQELLAAGRAYESLLWLHRKRFGRDWAEYKQQVDYDTIRYGDEDGFEGFGYRNYLMVSEIFKRMSKWMG